MSSLIIDAGSTKMEWALLDGRKCLKRFTTAGFNPNYAKPEQFEKILLQELPADLAQPDSIAYYGTGCGSEANCRCVKRLLQIRFPEADIFVTNDMMGAAIALFGKESGIACILGTGANSCLFDGEAVVDRAVSLGYLVGDEGSGCYIGRKLVRAYFYRLMPNDLQAIFETEYPLDLKQFIDRVYHQPEASRYLAGFVQFAGDHIDHPFIQDLVKDCFREFIKVFVERYPDCRNLPIGFVGSVAFYFQYQLHECLSAEGLTMGKVMRSPMEGLIQRYS